MKEMNEQMPKPQTAQTQQAEPETPRAAETPTYQPAVESQVYKQAEPPAYPRPAEAPAYPRTAEAPAAPKMPEAQPQAAPKAQPVGSIRPATPSQYEEPVYQKFGIMKAEQICNEVGKAITGKNEIIQKVMTVIVAGGHILLEDIPGVGKTTLALAFSRAMDLKFNRVQFTPDVVPSDITGFSLYNRATEQFEYKEGAAMCNILLADEINRTSSKTQSSLLEVMQEGNVTVDGVTHEVPRPFVVIATENPVETAGTQMLPEAQLDRFAVQISIGYPDKDAEMEILADRRTTDPLDTIRKVANANDVLRMREEARDVYIDPKIYDYVTDLVRASREHHLVRLGISPRGAISICSLAQAKAYIAGRNYVIPPDVQEVFHDAGRHRLMLTSQARLEGETADSILDQILQMTALPDVTRQ